MDSDDIALPGRLKLQLKCLQDNKNIDVLGSYAFLINENGENISMLKRPISNKVIISQLLAMNGISFPTICFKKIIAEKFLFNEQLQISEDLEWFIRLSTLYTFANVAEPLMKLRQVKNSRSRAFMGKDEHLISSIEEYLNNKLLEGGRKINKTEIFRNLGLVNYYYGSVKKARRYLLKSLFLNPLNLPTLRYLIPILIFPQGIFSEIRGNQFFLKLAMKFRLKYVK